MLLLCFILSLSSNVKLCNSSSIPLSLSAVVTDPVDLDLHARLLSDEIDCDFNHGTFCQLHNNGGWSFRQSLLEHDQMNLSVSDLAGCMILLLFASLQLFILERNLISLSLGEK